MKTENTNHDKNPKFNLQEAWEDFKFMLGVGVAIGGCYLLADVIPDDKVNGFRVWDTRGWKDFWEDASKPTSDPSLPNLDDWLGK